MRNNTLYLLERCKEGLRKTFEEFYEERSKVNYEKYLTNEEFKKARISMLKIYDEMNEIVPPIFKSCRTIEEFIHFLDLDTYNSTEYMGNLGFISSEFNTIIDYVELKSIEVQIIEVQCNVPDNLNYDSIIEDIKKCENRIDDGDYSGAITSAKSLIEGVCKELLYIIEGTEADTNLKFPELFKKSREHLGLVPKKQTLEKSLKDVVSGLIKVVQGINEIRNISGDGHTRTKSPSKHHAVLVVNSAKTVVSFLFDTYQYQLDRGNLKQYKKV
ncbi:hypothetical protein C6W22_19810 [Bacillus atrophaeus]|uniref:abortive infection family protein n=1 Tax=Bacillus atrophaeus TaxID=1452 RepID=UPI000D02FCAD|nr:abortive infection family protein [Bacillus atrophaeus]PRS03878.1 hypothetical protein C6W22_19810 [Bacillus atrophaeus]